MSIADKPDYLIKIVTVGNLCSGKSCIVHRYVDDEYCPSTCPTLATDYQLKDISIDDKKATLCIYDTCGYKHTHNINESYIRSSDITFIVYDVFNRDDFNVAIYWLELIQSKYKNVDIILIGAQIDKKSTSLREISSTEGSNIGTKYNVFFCECSAKNNINIDTIFDEAIAIYLRNKNTKAEAETLANAELSEHAQRQKESVKNSKVAFFFTKLQKIMHL